MALRPIVEAGDPVLRRRAAEVLASELGSAELLRLVDEMVAVMRAAPGVGLAAPQLGVCSRVIVLEDTAERMAHLSDEERRERARSDVPLTCIVNPVFESTSDVQDTYFEGCLSVPGYSALVARAHEVVVSGVTPSGEPIRLHATGWPARILQHELDHLDGTLYVDRMLARSLCTVDQVRTRYAGKSLVEIATELGTSLPQELGSRKEQRMASTGKSKIFTFLWYAREAEDAARFYTSIFPDSRVDRVTPMLSDSPSGPPGSVKVVDFTLFGQRFQAMTAGPHHDFNDAISITVLCDDQAELDRYWNALLEGGGKPQACGWLVDRFGLRWQIVPARMEEMMRDRDPGRSKRVTDAMLKMVKFDIAALEKAYRAQ